MTWDRTQCHRGAGSRAQLHRWLRARLTGRHMPPYSRSPFPREGCRDARGGSFLLPLVTLFIFNSLPSCPDMTPPQESVSWRSRSANRPRATALNPGRTVPPRLATDQGHHVTRSRTEGKHSLHCPFQGGNFSEPGTHGALPGPKGDKVEQEACGAPATYAQIVF